MNKVTLLGRLVKDAQLCVMQGTGKAMVTTTLAVNRKYKNQDGVYPADFINIRMYGKTAETASKYLSKGDKIAVNGAIYTYSYTNKQGETSFSYYVFVEEFDFCEQKNKDNNNYLPKEEQPTQVSIFDNPLGVPIDDAGALPF